MTPEDKDLIVNAAITFVAMCKRLHCLSRGIAEDDAETHVREIGDARQAEADMCKAQALLMLRVRDALGLDE